MKQKKTNQKYGEEKENQFESAIRPDPKAQKSKAVTNEPEIILEEKSGVRVWQSGYKLKKDEMITQHQNIHIGAIVVRRKK
jgi:hypothetical protein